jgi:hypothetical protein
MHLSFIPKKKKMKQFKYQKQQVSLLVSKITSKETEKRSKRIQTPRWRIGKERMTLSLSIIIQLFNKLISFLFFQNKNELCFHDTSLGTICVVCWWISFSYPPLFTYGSKACCKVDWRGAEVNNGAPNKVVVSMMTIQLKENATTPNDFETIIFKQTIIRSGFKWINMKKVPN